MYFELDFEDWEEFQQEEMDTGRVIPGMTRQRHGCGSLWAFSGRTSSSVQGGPPESVCADEQRRKCRVGSGLDKAEEFRLW